MNEDDDVQDTTGLSPAATRMLVGVLSICATVVSSNGWVDFRAAERNEKLLQAQQIKVEHIDQLITEIRQIHRERDVQIETDRKVYMDKLEQLIKKSCR
jgi:hypothetical protein